MSAPYAIILVLFGLLVLVASFTVFILGITLVSLLFYKFITGKKVIRRQVIVVCIVTLVLYVLGGFAAYLIGDGFGGAPGEPRLSAWEIIGMLTGYFSIYILAGCAAARLSQK